MSPGELLVIIGPPAVRRCASTSRCLSLGAAPVTVSGGRTRSQDSAGVRACKDSPDLRCAMHGMDQEEVDARIQTYYSELFVEAARLTVRSAQGRLKFERTQELIRARIPARMRASSTSAGLRACTPRHSQRSAMTSC